MSSRSSSRENDRKPAPEKSPQAVDAVREALNRCPQPGTAPSTNPWHRLLYNCLRDDARPSLIVKDAITPAASLWTGAREWTDAFRKANIRAGDRLIVALPPSVAFVQVLIAGLWEGVTLVPAPPDENTQELLSELDARATVASHSGTHSWEADEHQGPISTPNSLRAPTRSQTRDVRFLLRTSGTTQDARWIALSDENILSVLSSHLPYFSLRNARPLSVLPWTHAFGLILDLLPALLSGSVIIRDPEDGRTPSGIVDLADKWKATHLSAVPLTIDRLLDHELGPSLLQDLHGGVIGGAPISGPLANSLRDTRLRAGYGQTEASPGIALGPPGKWAANYLGRPVGCSVDVAEDGELLFEGPNSCIGVWRNEGLERLEPERTVHTGDLVHRDGQDLFFRGRKDQAFKLSNGRLVRANALESQLKSEYPSVRDVMVFTPDGRSIVVALCSDVSPSDLPTEEQIRRTLGSLGPKLTARIVVPPQEWIMKAKGTVDRTQMARTLQSQAGCAS